MKRKRDSRKGENRAAALEVFFNSSLTQTLVGAFQGYRFTFILVFAE